MDKKFVFLHGCDMNMSGRTYSNTAPSHVLYAYVNIIGTFNTSALADVCKPPALRRQDRPINEHLYVLCTRKSPQKSKTLRAHIEW